MLPSAPTLTEDQKPAPKEDLRENGKEQVLVVDPATLPEDYTIEYSTDGGKTWNAVPAGTEAGEYIIDVMYRSSDSYYTDFAGESMTVAIKKVYTVIWLDAAVEKHAKRQRG